MGEDELRKGASVDIAPPSVALQFLEARAAAEYAALLLQLPILRLQAPRGHGEPVMVLPGFMADDTSTWLLRSFLRSIGYVVAPWGQGLSRGRMMDFVAPTIDRVARLHAAHGAKVRLVGWSRGGTLAREIARDRPELVDRVITLGSPVKGGAGATSIARLVRRQTGLGIAEMQQLMRARNKVPIQVPITAIYSKSDGVVAWQACVDDVSPDVTHFTVEGSHSGLGVNAAVYRIVAKALR
jgi:pimeloyl-ACP methyl ester carboxylesterase